MANSKSVAVNILSKSSNRLRSLKKRSDFLSLIKSGKKIHPCKWMFISYRLNSLDYNRFGWTISRQVGTSVVRNKLKRWCRNYFLSKNSSLFNNFDINVIFRPNEKDFYKSISFEEFCLQLSIAWKKLKSEDQKIKNARHIE